MDYIIRLANDKIFSSSDDEYLWRNLKRKYDNNEILHEIVQMGIYDLDGNFYELNRYDIYFFSDEATFDLKREFVWENRKIGGFKSNGEGKIIIVPARHGKEVEVIKMNLDNMLKIYNKNAFIGL